MFMRKFFNMIFGSFKGFHRLNPTSPAVPKPENIEWLFHFCRLENDPNAELLLFFDFGVATYRRQSFSECPRCGISWDCGEANYQDECPYPTRTLCTKCWAQEVPR